MAEIAAMTGPAQPAAAHEAQDTPKGDLGRDFLAFVEPAMAAPDTTLTAADRCDKCGAQAYVRVRLITGELHFCAHHAKQFEPSLKKLAVEIQDETARLTEV